MKKQKQEAGIILLYATKILLVFQRASNLWGIPKGTKKDDEDLYSCALRELHEETGIVITNYDRYVGKLKLGNITAFMFETLEKYVPIPIHTDEILKAEWMYINNIKYLRHNISIRDWFSVNEIRKNKNIDRTIINVEIKVTDTGDVNLILRNVFS
jgi:8-oxo-dGTP pyrophosphatase MutT (NUDIX family)